MISTEQQLCSAAERLGVQVEDLQLEFRARITSSASGTNLDSDISTTDANSMLQSDAINKALNESLFAICERAFGNSPCQGTSFSPAYSTPLSPALLNPTQHADNDSVDNNSAASASSSAAAAPRQSNSKAKSEILTVSCCNPISAEPSVPSASQTRKEFQEIPKIEPSQRHILEGSRKETSPLDRSEIHSLSKTPSHAPLTTPIDSILSFARGQQLSLTDVSDLEEQNALCKMRSLSVIPGCDKYNELCVYTYIGALFKAHLNLVQDFPKHQNESMFHVDDLKCEITDTSWRTIFTGAPAAVPVKNEELAENCPPIIRNSVDLFQFTYRLVDKMSSASDLLTRGFLEGLYASGTPKLVASVTTRLLSRWANAWCKIPSFPRQSLLLEWCIRLLLGFIVSELSPVSQFRDMKDISSDSFVVFNLGKEGLPPLSIVINYCFQFVSSRQVGKDCRLALCEVVQAYFIWSTCRRPDIGGQAQLWTDTQEERQEYLNALVGKEAFWTIVVQCTLQHVKKLPQLADSYFEYTFLSSLVSIGAAKRALFDDKQDKSKWMLLNLMIRNLELMNRDLLSWFVEAERCRRLFPGIHTSTDFVRGLIASAAVQREILSADPATKSRFLSSLVMLITNAAKVIRSSLDVDEAMEYARKGPFAKIFSTDLGPFEADPECGDSDHTGTKKGSEQMDTVDHVLARERAVAFAAILIGCLGKSVEDGSWDMSRMNSIKALFHARINSSRTRYRLWNDIYKIQRSVEKKIGKQVLLSTPERNSFAMVVEIVRKHVACDPADRNTDLPSQENSAGSQAISTAKAVNDVRASFPPVWDISELQHAVCSSEGYTDFDNDHDMLMFMKDVLTDKGQQMLARYDPKSPFTVKWIRLQKRNAYIGRARDLLDEADRTVGQRCSCVPGYPKENGNGSESRVACSNDLCENRHMKIECAPGKCGSGSYCMNQRMQNLEYAKFKMVPFRGKGVGIVADEDIPEGALVGEYQGEVVTMEEYERRVQEYEGERHFYFMTLTNKLVIDASRKSQATRFLNHSCDPNSETQKWNADGEPRVGIFTKRAISKGEEITFDYGARSLTQCSAKCLCGAKNCRGLLAVRKEEIGSLKNLVQESPTKSDDCTERTQEIGSTSPRRKRKRFLEENRRDSVVREKIKIATKYLDEANILARKADEYPRFQHDRKLSSDVQKKLKLWKTSLSRGAGTSAVPEKGFEDSREEVRFPRIPRRGALRAKDDKHVTERSRDASAERKNSTRRISASTDADPLAVGQNVRSSIANRRGSSASRWALFEETVAGKLGDSQTPQKRPAEGDSIRRSSKVPRSGFCPTTSKLKKKQPLRPKFAKRKRTRDQDENDSMGEYSTASEAEPILEEPITSPSRLPDGNGACSDDEFVAAPPVESIRTSPARRRLNHSDYERRGYVEKQMSRSEFDRDGEQTREGRKLRYGSSHGLAWDRADPNLQLHATSGHGAPSPRAQDRLGPMRADLRDVHGADLSGPITDRRRYGGYRHEWSPAKERYRRPHTGRPENKREVHASEEVSDVDHHPRLGRQKNHRAFEQKMHDTAYVTSGSRYPEAEASTLHHTKERRHLGHPSSLRHDDDDQDWSRMPANDMVKPLSTKLGSTKSDFRSRTQLDPVRRANRRNQDLRRSLLDGDNVALNQPYHEISEPTRFPHTVTSQSVDSLEGRPRGDHKYSYSAKTETHWVPSRSAENRVDLRDLITGRSRKKNQ